MGIKDWRGCVRESDQGTTPNESGTESQNQVKGKLHNLHQNVGQ